MKRQVFSVYGELDLVGILTKFDGLRVDQLPFATAQALRKVAKDAEKAMHRRLPRAFRLRSKSLAKTFKSTRFVKKGDWPHQEAMVWTTARSMLLQETGGVKRARKGRVAVPTRHIKRSATTGRISKARRPRALLRRKNVSMEGDAIVQRFKSKPSKALYHMRPATRIRETLRMRETVQGVVAKRMSRRLFTELGKAIGGR